MRLCPFLLVCLVGASAACHPGPVVSKGPNPSVGGTIAVNGGYTIKVPEGTYRLELELRASETLGKKPDDTHVNNGDLDPDGLRLL